MAARIQLRRAKGWRMPENAVKVDRTTPWGNPFVVGKDGDARQCVDLYAKLLSGFVCVSCNASVEAQRAARAHVEANFGLLRGRDLACWCRDDRACHADLLLRIANA